MISFWAFYQAFCLAPLELVTCRIHGPIKSPPEFDAGGLRVKERSFAGAEYAGRPSSLKPPELTIFHDVLVKTLHIVYDR